MHSLLSTLGFGQLPVEAAYWVLFTILLASLLAAWLVDNIMQDLGFGVMGNAALLFSGAVVGLVLWNLYYQPASGTDPFTLVLVAVGAAFASVLLSGILRRFTG